MQRARKRVFQLCFENDEDDFIIFAVRRPRWIRERAEDFDSLYDRDFITRYRLTKPTVLSILEKIEHHLEYKTDRSVSEVRAYNNKKPSKYNSFFFSNRNNCISPINQLLCTLRFYATGCFQTTAGDLCGFSSSTVNRIVHKVSCTIASLRSQYIKFPETPEQIRQTQLNFYRRAKFPRVIGAIDCTHVKLWQSPGIYKK